MSPKYGATGFFSTARSFSPPVGTHIDPSIRGYYIDFRLKAEEPEWPPPWLLGPGEQVWVAIAQWGLGAYEHHLETADEAWLRAAESAGRFMIENQWREGELDGSWFHRFPLSHTYRLPPPWVSAMAQGEGASLLVRLGRATGREEYADAARRALAPMRVPVAEGGAYAELDGGFFPEEYPTRPSSYVLNGGIFALWGCYDVAGALDDPGAGELDARGVETLAANIGRYDLGYWSLYDLFPHPVGNIASSAYHRLHINQLRALSLTSGREVFADYADRFQGYESSRTGGARAFGRKAAFRVVVPRNRYLAHRTPWARRRRRGREVLVLCYHAVSEDWPSVLAVTGRQLDEQLELLSERGYKGATFHDAVHNPPAEKTVAVTFDDGYLSVLERAAPILERYGMPGTIFVPTQLVDSDDPMGWPGIDQWLDTPHREELRPLTWAQLKQMAAAGWEIGSHTRTHPVLTELDDEELRRELVGSRQDATEAVGIECRTLAYPFGSEDDRVEEAAISAGYAAAAALPHPLLTVPTTWRWPRIGVYRADELKRFERKVSPALRVLRRQPVWRIVQARHRLKRAGR